MFVFTAFSSVYAIESPRYADDETHMIEGHEFMKIVDGLTTPTSMTFVDNDILVIEKNSGKVIHVKSDDYTKNEILDFSVSFGDESGLLGITSIENNVFLYMTESLSGTDVYDNTNSRIAIYHFVWKDEISEGPVLIKEFPISISNAHVGGAMASDNDSIYFVIGDQRQSGKYQNIPETQTNSEYVTSSIFKLNIDDNTLEHFAMGIRNSFGLAIDPVTGSLWNTENGDNYFDEINLVPPKFNSGWMMVMGPVERLNLDTCEYNHLQGHNTCIEWWFQEPPTTSYSEKTKLNLISADKQKIPSFEDFEYSDPEFSWWKTTGVTAIAFPDEYGFGNFSEYAFVSDFNNGRIYKFKLNSDRTDFIFETPILQNQHLSTKNNHIFDFDNEEIHSIIRDFPEVNFGIDEIGFASSIPGGISDIKFHKGEMYVISIFDGAIYKISPNEDGLQNQNFPPNDDVITRGELILRKFVNHKSDEFTMNYKITDISPVNFMPFNPAPVDRVKDHHCTFNSLTENWVPKSPDKDCENSSYLSLHFSSGMSPQRAMNVVNQEYWGIDVFDRITTVWSMPNKTDFSTDDEIFNFIKNEEMISCKNNTMDRDFKTCQNMRYLGTTIADTPHVKAYTLMSKSENKYYYEFTSVDDDGVAETFAKFEVINLSSWIFEEDKIWIIYATMFEEDAEWYIPNFINTVESFELTPKSLPAKDLETPKLPVKDVKDEYDAWDVPKSEGGGCLIATATYGSEMAPQVQMLRELRDNTVLQTQYGTSFMVGFNQFYYSFSPVVADYERENPVFKEIVKVTLTPMLTSLTLLNYLDIDSEEVMLGSGVGIILLNVGMYFVAPIVLIISLKKRFCA